MSAVGALLGFVFAGGVLLAVLASPPMRRPRLADRVGPYVADTPRPSRLLDRAGQAMPFGAAGRQLAPVLIDAARRLEVVVGGSRSVRRRLLVLGSPRTVEDFRIEQIIWGVAGVLVGALAGVALSAAAGSMSVLALAMCVLTGGLVGVLGRDWLLSAQVSRRQQRMLAELPVIAELLALAVTAGETPGAALERVCRLCRGDLARELGTALVETRSGTALPVALQALAARTSLDQLARFTDGLIIALERGTPLADVLRAQAADVREASKRALLASGGRREIAMMVPVVFLILPLTVLFALYPGLVNISLLTR